MCPCQSSENAAKRDIERVREKGVEVKDGQGRADMRMVGIPEKSEHLNLQAFKTIIQDTVLEIQQKTRVSVSRRHIQFIDR